MKRQYSGVGIIGCGSLSKAHIKAFNALHNECTVRALADPNVANANMLSEFLRDKVDVYEDISFLLKREDIGIVSICTPPFLHKEQVIQAFRCGKHVICEKPFAPSLADCDDMIKAARDFERKLCVTMQLRFGTDFKRVKHIVESGLLGPIHFAEMQGLYWRGPSYYEKDWRGRWESEAGGVMMTLGIHPLDLFLDILGPVDSVSAEMASLNHQVEVEDQVAASLTFRNQTKAHILCTLNSVENGISMRFSGETKAVSFPLDFHAVKESEGGFPLPDEKGIEELRSAAAAIIEGCDDHFGPIADMVAAIKEGREPFVNGLEARKSIEVVTAIYKSATLGESVLLPITNEDPWYTTKGIQKHVKRNAL